MVQDDLHLVFLLNIEGTQSHKDYRKLFDYQHF